MHNQRSSTRKAGRQAEKSAATRRLTLQAAVDCFVELGYARTTTTLIANRAGLSRGAMIHHFPTKRRLLDAAVEYLIEQRIESFSRDMLKLRNQRRGAAGVEAYWRHLHSRLFIAYHELLVAARTDPELALVMRRAARKFEDAWNARVIEVFPEWRDRTELFELAMDITQFLLEGMALNRLAHKPKQRQKRIRAYLVARLNDIFAAGSGGKADAAVLEFLAYGRKGGAGRDTQNRHA
jgi:AcrR family transcriptional regulator